MDVYLIPAAIFLCGVLCGRVVPRSPQKPTENQVGIVSGVAAAGVSGVFVSLAVDVVLGVIVGTAAGLVVGFVASLLTFIWREP